MLDLRAILQKKLRKPELPVRQYLLAAAFLPLAGGLALAGMMPAAVSAVLGGFITLAIAGMLIKISSFLTWQHRYSGQAGKQPVPLLRDMTVPALGELSNRGLAGGMLLITLALVWRAPALAFSGALLASAGAWALTLHVLWITFGLHRPHQPAASRETAAQQAGEA
jgi:hypothetical protein